MARPDLERLPSVLATLLAPWVRAVEDGGPGTGRSVMAVAEHALSALRNRVAPSRRLERAFVEARAATARLAAALDGGALLPGWRRDAARDALAELIVWLRRAEPSEVTRELGLGW